MLNLLATLVVTALPATPGGVSACPDPSVTNLRSASAEAAVGAAAPAGAVGECNEAAPLDLWYRMSRFADVDPGAVGAGPARRLQPNRGLASCDAPQTPAQLQPPQAPPVALFALPTLFDVHVPPRFIADAHTLPVRAIAPPERPPRA